MSIKIAVICSKAFKNRILSIAQNMDHIQLEFTLYQQPSDVPVLLKQVKPCDALLLGGTLPYLYAQPFLETFPIPWNYIKQDETAITTTLLSLLAKQRVPLQRISIDVMNPTFVDHVLNDIAYTGPKPYVFPISMDEKNDHILKKHVELWRTKNIDFVITSIHTVFDELQALNIPSMRMLDATSSIIQCIEETISKSLLTKSESVKAVVGLLEMPTFNTSILEQIVAATHSTYKQITSNQFELYTTAGHLQAAFENGRMHYLFQETENPVKLAYGYGHSISEAAQNAKYALQYAKPFEIYILDEHKHLLGPFPNPKTKQSLKTNDPFILEMAKQTNLSPLNISKIINFSRERQSTQFTTHNLAEYLQVTRRTTERIIKKLVDQDYVKVVGEEMPHQQGRPRTIYELNFATY